MPDSGTLANEALTHIDSLYGAAMWLTRNPADAEAEARLAAFGLHVSVPASDDHEQIELVDVRSCDYDGGPMAHLLYEVEGQSFSLFVIPEARHAEGTLEVLGHQERLWSNDREACVLVGPEDAVAMDKVAAYVRG